MSKFSPEMQAFITKWEVRPDEVWPVPGGKAYAVKHSALERIAAQTGIQFGVPNIVEGSSEAKTVVLLGTAKLGDRQEWSFGEASPVNNRNAYCWAMAEKRLKDRLTLKLISVHGMVYSEEEADDFKQQAYQPPGEPMPIKADFDTPKKSAHSIKRDKPDLWPTIVTMFRDAATYEELRDVAGGEFVQTATKDWPIGWVDALRDEFSTCAIALREQAA